MESPWIVIGACIVIRRRRRVSEQVRDQTDGACPRFKNEAAAGRRFRRFSRFVEAELIRKDTGWSLKESYRVSAYMSVTLQWWCASASSFLSLTHTHTIQEQEQQRQGGKGGDNKCFCSYFRDQGGGSSNSVTGPIVLREASFQMQVSNAAALL